MSSTITTPTWRRISLLVATAATAVLAILPTALGTAAAVAVSPVAPKHKVAVDVFFRAFCPACQWFVGDPLLELIGQEEFRNIINLNVYPAAGMVEKNGVFDCEGGELECDGHQWEICIIEKDRNDVVKYLGGLACVEGDESGEIGEWETKLNNCFTAGERAILTECYEKRSANLLREMMKDPRFDKVEWMPYTIVETTVLGSESKGVGLQDLHTHVCSSYKGPKKYYPDMCHQLVGEQKQFAPDEKEATIAPVAAAVDSDVTPKPAAPANHEGDQQEAAEEGEVEMDLPMKGDEEDHSKVRMELYWRAFCPGCRAFISSPLKKLLSDPEFREIIDFRPTPAAGTSRDAQGLFQCTKGVVECQGHRWLSCVIDEFPKVDQLVVHLACLENKDNRGSTWSSVIAKCFSGGDHTRMRSCYDTRSKPLLAKHVARREKVEIQWVPYVLLDSVVIGDARHGIGYKQLEEEVCKAYKGSEKRRPTACQPKRLRQDDAADKAATETEKVIKPCPPKKEAADGQPAATVAQDAPGAGFRRPTFEEQVAKEAKEAAQVERGLEKKDGPAAVKDAALRNTGGESAGGFSFGSLLFPLGCFAVIAAVARRFSGDHKKDA